MSRVINQPKTASTMWPLLIAFALASMTVVPKTGAADPSPYLKQRSSVGSPVEAVTYATDGQLIVAGRAPTVRGLDDQLRQAWEQVLDTEFTSTTGLAVRGDGSLVITATDESEMYLWRRDDPAADVMHSLLDDCPLALAFSPDGRHLAAGCEGGVVSIWDTSKWLTGGKLATTTAEPQRTIDLKSDDIVAIAYSPDGKHLAVSVRDVLPNTKTKILNESTGVVEMEFSASGTKLAFSPDGRRLFSGNRVFNTSNWETIYQLDYPFTVTAAAFSPDGSWLVTGGNDNRVVFWDARSGKRLAAIRAHDDTVSAIALDARGQSLATGSDDWTVALWGTQRILAEKPLAEPFAKLANTPEAFDCWRLATDWTRGVLAARNDKRRPPALGAAIERAKQLQISLPELPADLDTEPAVKRVFAEAPKITAQLAERYSQAHAEIFMTCLLMRVFQDYYDPSNPQMAEFKVKALPGLRLGLIDVCGGAPDMLVGLEAALDAKGENAGAAVRTSLKRLIREVDVYLEAQHKARTNSTR
jgi:hypothetical protein